MTMHIPAHKNTQSPAGQVSLTSIALTLWANGIPEIQYNARQCGDLVSMDRSRYHHGAESLCGNLDAPEDIPAGSTRRSMFADDPDGRDVYTPFNKR